MNPLRKGHECIRSVVTGGRWWRVGKEGLDESLEDQAERKLQRCNYGDGSGMKREGFVRHAGAGTDRTLQPTG